MHSNNLGHIRVGTDSSRPCWRVERPRERDESVPTRIRNILSKHSFLQRKCSTIRHN